MAVAEKLNYLLDTKNQIKEAIKEKGVSVQDTDSFRSYAEKIQEIEGGEERQFYNIITNNGTSLSCLFASRDSNYFNDPEIVAYVKNMDTSKVENFEKLFYQTQSTVELDFSNWDMSSAKKLSYMFYMTKPSKITLRDKDLSKVIDISHMCANCSNTTEIDLTNNEFGSLTHANGVFSYCTNLIEIKGILDFTSVMYTSNFITGSTKLQKIFIKNLKTTLDLSSAPNLAYDCLIYLINNLQEVATTKTLTLGATNLAKLTDEEKAIATNKNWTLA